MASEVPPKARGPRGQRGHDGPKGDPGDQGAPGLAGDIISDPPPGCKKVKNLYVNESGKFVVVYDDTPV